MFAAAPSLRTKQRRSPSPVSCRCIFHPLIFLFAGYSIPCSTASTRFGLLRTVEVDLVLLLCFFLAASIFTFVSHPGLCSIHLSNKTFNLWWEMYASRPVIEGTNLDANLRQAVNHFEFNDALVSKKVGGFLSCAHHSNHIFCLPASRSACLSVHLSVHLSLFLSMYLGFSSLCKALSSPCRRSLA